MFAALPKDTQQLIVREAYLFRAGEIIMQALKEAQERHAQVKSSRPPFLVLRRQETKETFQANLTDAKSDLSLYERALKRNSDAMRRLRKCAELHIEDWLRENDPAYYAGLVSESLVADWHRCLSRLETELADFITAVGCARNALVSSKFNKRGEIALSEVSLHAIGRAAEIGVLLATDVAATNGLAVERDRHLQGTAFESAFPRLPSFDFAASLKEANGLHVSLLQKKFDSVLERCDELRSVGLPALLQQVRESEEKHTAVKDSYLVGVWQGLRRFAIANHVEEQELNEVARATEEMFEDGIFS